MHAFDGLDYSGTPPATFAGKGVWTIAQVADDADPRDATNLFLAAEANRNAIVWLMYRTPDWYSGGTQDVQANVTFSTTNGSGILWGVPMTFIGTVFRLETLLDLVGGAVLDVGDPAGALGAGTIRVTKDGTITGDPGSVWNLSGTTAHPTTVTLTGDNATSSKMNLVLDSGARLNSDATSRVDLLGRFTRTGASAIETCRPGHMDFGTTAYTFTDSDTWIVNDPNAGPGFTATLAPPAGLPSGLYRFTVRQEAKSTNYTTTQSVAFQQISGNALFTFTPGLVSRQYPASVMCEYDTDSALISIVGMFDKNSIVSLP